MVITVDSSVVILVEVVWSCEMSGSNNTCGSSSSNRVASGSHYSRSICCSSIFI